MRSSPIQSVRHLPSTSMPAAISAPPAVYHSMSSAFTPPVREASRSGYAAFWLCLRLNQGVYVDRTGLDTQLWSAITMYRIDLYCWSEYPEWPCQQGYIHHSCSYRNAPAQPGLATKHPPYSHRPHSVGPRGVIHPQSPPHHPRNTFTLGQISSINTWVEEGPSPTIFHLSVKLE